jgi:tetratricopeptide (TPR) repeat protein
MLGEAAMELGQYDAAGQAFSSLRSPTSHLSIAGRTARWAEVSGDLAAARHIIRIARDAAVERFDVTLEQRSWFRMRYADIERRSGRPRLARKELEAALLENPTDRRLMMTMARHALADDDVGRATELAEDAMDVSLDADVLVLLCRAALAAGDSMRVEELEGALMTMVTGAGPSVHRSVDLYLLDRGRDVEEILARARASLVERHDVYGWDLYAWALYRAGRIADASSASSIALSLRTADPALYERAAVIARAAGYVEHAKALELRAERLGGA